jgi:hypothetical protein
MSTGEHAADVAVERRRSAKSSPEDCVGATQQSPLGDFEVYSSDTRGSHRYGFANAACSAQIESGNNETVFVTETAEDEGCLHGSSAEWTRRMPDA